MNKTLSWSYEWNLIVWTNWIIFHNTFRLLKYFDTFLQNKNFKVVKEKSHRISPPLESCKYGYSRLTTNTAAFRYSRQKTSQCFIIHEKPSDSDNSNERECVTKMTYNNDFCLRKKSYILVVKSQNWRSLIISIKRQSSLYTCNEWL